MSSRGSVDGAMVDASTAANTAKHMGSFFLLQKVAPSIVEDDDV